MDAGTLVEQLFASGDTVPNGLNPWCSICHVTGDVPSALQRLSDAMGGEVTLEVLGNLLRLDEDPAVVVLVGKVDRGGLLDVADWAVVPKLSYFDAAIRRSLPVLRLRFLLRRHWLHFPQN